MSKYENGQALADKVAWEGGAGEFIFGYGIDPGDLPDDTPGHVVAAVERLHTQAVADLATFENWLPESAEAI